MVPVGLAGFSVMRMAGQVVGPALDSADVWLRRVDVDEELFDHGGSRRKVMIVEHTQYVLNTG